MLDVLVVEDTLQYVRRLRKLLCDKYSGYRVQFVKSRDEALALIAQAPPDLIILDLVIPSAPKKKDAHASHGEAVLRAVRSIGLATPVIVLSGRDDVVRDFLIEKGADDFFVKGHPTAWEEEKLPAQIERYIGHLACRSEAMKELRRQLDELPPDERVVTLEGPSGSGKEHLGRTIHKCSSARNGRFEVVDLLALAPNNNLAELIGRTTPAPKPGLLASGAGAVLLRDLADNVDGRVQSGLARLVQAATEGGVAFRPVGATEKIAADCWLMFSSARPIDDLLREGRLSEELHTALRCHPVLRVPAPSERLEDTGELLEVFRRRARHHFGNRVRRVGADVVATVERWLSVCPPAGGWDAVEATIRDAVSRCEGRDLRTADLRLPPMPASYEVVKVRDGQIKRCQVSEVELAALEAQEWPLVMFAEEQDGKTAVVRVRINGENRPISQPRVGRLLYVLAANAGQQVDVASLWRELALTSKTQTKRLIFDLRRCLNDGAVDGRRSRYVASHYYQTYEFLTDTDFLLVRPLRRRSEDADGSRVEQGRWQE